MTCPFNGALRHWKNAKCYLFFCQMNLICSNYSLGVGGGGGGGEFASARIFFSMASGADNVLGQKCFAARIFFYISSVAGIFF